MPLEFSELQNTIRRELGIENEWTDPMRVFNFFLPEDGWVGVNCLISEPNRVDFRRYTPIRLAAVILHMAEICLLDKTQLGPDLDAFRQNFPETYDILKTDPRGCLQMIWMNGKDCWTRHWKRYPDLEHTIITKGTEEDILHYFETTVGFRLPKELEKKYSRVLNITGYQDLPTECPPPENRPTHY